MSLLAALCDAACAACNCVSIGSTAVKLRVAVRVHDSSFERLCTRVCSSKVPSCGWSLEAIERGCAHLGLPPVMHGIFPKGAASLIEEFIIRSNDQLALQLDAADFTECVCPLLLLLLRPPQVCAPARAVLVWACRVGLDPPWTHWCAHGNHGLGAPLTFRACSLRPWISGARCRTFTAAKNARSGADPVCSGNAPAHERSVHSAVATGACHHGRPCAPPNRAQADGTVFTAVDLRLAVLRGCLARATDLHQSGLPGCADSRAVLAGPLCCSVTALPTLACAGPDGGRHVAVRG